MSPAMNEEEEGIESVASLLSELDEAVREGCTRHFVEDDEEMVVEDNVMDVRVGSPDSQSCPVFNVSFNPDATLRSFRPETHAESDAEVSIDTDMETGVSDRRVLLREEDIVSPRYHLDAPSDRESMVESRGKTSWRAEASEYSEPLRPVETSSSELHQTSAADADKMSTGGPL